MTPALDLRWRLRHVGVCVAFAALCLNSSAGLLTPDTKSDLVVDPGRFLGRALQLWDPQGFGGQVQNQAYGYLFPMGPFFWLQHLAGIPGWVTQRLWWTLLLSVAFLGVERLGRALALGTPLSRLVAGVAYACSPRVLTLLGANSIEGWPMALAPWIVLPLVSNAGTPRRAGLRCGVAILFLGGVNAAADLGALLPAVLWLATRRPSRELARTAGWALLGAVAASGWWLVPLMLQGRYSPPFLDYIESGRTTSGVTSLVETLRGTSDWVPYLPSAGWDAGYLLLTRPTLIVASVVVAAFGLAGLAANRSAHRTWLVATFAAGLVLVTFGHQAGVGPLASAAERDLLDGLLAPVRNIHKFDPLVRLPLVLALADLLPRLHWGRDREAEQSRLLVRAAAVVAVAGVAVPLLTLRLANRDTFTEYPGYWRQAATWLAGHPGRSLLAPASTTPHYIWGTPTDEPLQALAHSAWDVRNNIPLAPPGHIRMLDAVDQLLGSGVAQPALAPYLARAGYRYLVVRNDLDYHAVGAVPPAAVQATLAGSPGLTRVASFGPLLGDVGSYSASVDQGLQPLQPAVVIWRVGGTGDPRVTTATGLTRLSGGPESVLALQQAGVAPGAATVLSGSPTGGAPTTQVVLTDGLRRREVNYGGASGQHSVTLAADDPGLVGRRVPDYWPVAGEQHQSVVRWLGARAVRASSSGADPTGFFAVNPDQQPWSAFDGDASTAWRPAPDASALGQWVEADLTTPHIVRTVTVRVTAGVRQVSVTVGGRVASAAVHDGVATVTFPAASTRSVRVTVAGVGDDTTAPAGIVEVQVPGLRLGRTVVAPRDLPDGHAVDVIAFAAPGDARSGCLLIDEAPSCIAGRARGSEDGNTLDRSFTLPQGASYLPAVAVQARPGPTLDALLDRATDPTITATASSQAVPDELAGPRSAVDRDVTTGWVADPADADPTLTLRLERTVTLDRLTFLSSATLNATRPDLLRIDSPAGTRQVVIGADGIARFRPLTTDTLTLHLGVAEPLRPVLASSIADVRTLGIGVAEIVVPGVRATSRPATAARPVTLPCGRGPTLTVDGRRIATSVRTTVGALRDGRTIAAQPCDNATVALGAGGHRVVLAGTALWTPQQLTFVRPGTAVGNSAPDVRVRTWGRTDRSVAVAARSAGTVLVVNENVNPGWRATLDGHRLPTVTVDGWRQAWVLPAGPAGTVHLTFTPQRTYAGALVGGALAALALVVVVVLLRRRPGPVSLRPLQPPRAVVLAGVVALAALLGGAVGAIVAVGTVAVLVLAGRFWAAAVMAAGAYLVAGGLLAVHHWALAGYVGNDAPLQVLGLVGVCAAVTGRIRERDRERDG